MTNDEVQGITFRLTEEDITQACQQCGIPRAELYALWRSKRQQDESIHPADVLHMMILAKSKNLNPADDIYALIPRAGGKGFSMTFTKLAAFQVINNHPRVKPGSMRRWFENSKGEKILWAKSPSYMQFKDGAVRGALSLVDWSLEAHIAVTDIDGNELEGVAKYINCYASGQDGNPKYLWLKAAGEMTMKQAAKDLANSYLGGGLPDEEEGEEARLMDAGPVRRMEAPTINVSPAPAPTPTSEAGPSPLAAIPPETLERIVEKMARLGPDRGATMAMLKAQVEDLGISIVTVEKNIDKNIELRFPDKVRTAPVVAATGESKPMPDIPLETFAAVQAVNKAVEEISGALPVVKEKQRRARKPPWPRRTVQGTIDGIADRLKEVTKQKYLVINVGSLEANVWDTKLFDVINDAYDQGTEVQVTYTVSGDDPDTQYASVVEVVALGGGEAAPAAQPVEEDKPSPVSKPEPAADDPQATFPLW